MKLFLPLSSFAAAIRDDSNIMRIWNPDVDEKIFKTLTIDALTFSWSLPTDPVSGKYEPNKYYRVTVDGPEGHKIRADLSNFRLEGVGGTGTCTNDKVDIFDGSDGNNLLTTYCGKGVKAAVKSTGTRLTLVFKSNENGFVETGFDVDFTAEPLPLEDGHWNSIVSQYELVYNTIYDQLPLTRPDQKRLRLVLTIFDKIFISIYILGRSIHENNEPLHSLLFSPVFCIDVHLN